MKRIEYILPIDYLRGNISGTQDLSQSYDGGSGYSVPAGSKVSAGDYQPIMVAKVAHMSTRKMFRYFQVRTRTSVNMTAALRHNLALMGGAGALFASLVSDKTTDIYIACAGVVPRGETLRAFIIPLLRAGLAAKDPVITISGNISIVNPWVSSATPNVPVSQTILDKFSDELSNC